MRNSEGEVLAGNKTKMGAAAVAAALCVAIPFIMAHEGESLTAYKDSAGIWTICHGETFNVSATDKLTKEQCDTLSHSRVGMFMLQITPMLKVNLEPATLAAHTSFAYNIGIEGYRRSTALRLTNAGNLKAGCAAMLKWTIADGKDCKVRANNCYGLFTRRQDEVNLCLSGIK